MHKKIRHELLILTLNTSTRLTTIKYPGHFIYLIFISIISIVLFTGDCRAQSTDPRIVAYEYLQQGKANEAEFAFLKAIRINPREVLNYEDLALLYLKEKKYDKARVQTANALRLSPDNLMVKSILAKIYIETGNKQAALKELKTILAKNPKNIYAFCNLAALNSADNSYVKDATLIKLITIAPDNIVFRLQLAELLARKKKADLARFYLQSIKKIAPDFSASASSLFRQSIQALNSGRFSNAIININQFHNLMKPTAIYARSYAAIQGPNLSDGHLDFLTSEIQNKNRTKGGSLRDIKFTDISANVGLNFSDNGKSVNPVVAVTDYNHSGDMYLYIGNLSQNNSNPHLLSAGIGSYAEIKVNSSIAHAGTDLDAAFADYDNDGNQDLFIATTQGIIICKNNGDGTFTKTENITGLRNVTDARKMLFADFDQDGDLDLFVSQKKGSKFFRNNGNGTFTENSARMGLSVTEQRTMDFGDVDNDGDIDIVASDEKGQLKLLDNNRHAQFITKNIMANQPLACNGKVIILGDYNNDGLLDILASGNKTGECFLLRNTGKGFIVDRSSNLFTNALKGININDAAFFDFDNDGYLDVMIAGNGNDQSARGVRLFHNESGKSFTDVTNLLPAGISQASHIAIADFNADGDDDIFLSGSYGVKLLRNDGGNSNHYLQIQLTGLSYGNSKNNRLGIGAQVELKAGDLYQLRTAKRSVLNMGIGMRDKVDVVRVIWPNGAPQTIVDPSQNERIIEKELLKGSCPFLFTWNGKKYEFIKDMLWRSALGMPLAIHGTDTTYMFSDASKEYLLIPGEKLQPKDGRYSLKITEELWEAVYVDKAGLVAVDHPDSVDVYADERFVPPPFPGKNVYRVAQKHLPVSAKDENGNNLLPKISAYDFQYAADFSLGKFQGLAQDHDLILDLGSKAQADSLHLFLRGWIFPTDASINTAIAQSNTYAVHPPSLQVINQRGEWQTVIPNMGFPMGRDKIVVADLSGKFLTKNDRRVRISTNMQIYWDHVFFSAGNAKAPVLMHDLHMLKAKLGYRGYSASYRKGGPYGPEWFDYDKVTRGQKWRDLAGSYTRYGDVLPLLQKADDEYIICDGGDEISIDFDAQKLPVLPRGWKRDFLIYSEGWVKDGDLNTANGQTVAPLPFHNMPSYPYGKNVAYPTDREHQQYQQRYNTRKVTTDDFKNALNPEKLPLSK